MPRGFQRVDEDCLAEDSLAHRLTWGPASAQHSGKHRLLYVSFEVSFKPAQRTLDDVALMSCICENVPLVRVYNKSRLNAERFECVPEFIGLRRRTFSVAVPDQNKRWRLGVLDEVDG